MADYVDDAVAILVLEAVHIVAEGGGLSPDEAFNLLRERALASAEARHPERAEVDGAVEILLQQARSALLD